ncbi:MAG: N-acetyltransferase [Syntrophorhabdaceae bacterium]|nr:N-acetyltransferase [Syntrophorhabdaceae bacterium]
MLKKASIENIKEIHRIINAAASKGEMLPRSLGELYDNMRDYFVYIDDSKVIGTGALHICWEDLAEIRSICVVDTHRMKGIGKKIVEATLEEAKSYMIKHVFLLTYQIEFFEKCGFHITDKKDLPQKIWSDCIKCPKFPQCDETAMRIELF